MAQVSPRQKNWLKIAITLLALGAGLFFISRSSEVSWERLFETLQTFDSQSVALALLLCTVQVIFMAARLWALCPTDHPVPLKRVIYAVSLGQFANAFLPARAGDVGKVAWLRTAENPIPLSAAAGVVLSDKAVDLLSLVVVIIITGAYNVVDVGTLAPPTWILLVALAALLGLFIVVRSQLSARFPTVARGLREFRDGTKGLLTPKKLSLAVTLGVCCWLCEGGALALLVNAIGFDFTLSQGVFVLVILNAAIAVPVMVGNVGPFEASIVLALGKLEIPITPALAVATLHHLLQVIGVSLVAGVSTLLVRLK